MKETWKKSLTVLIAGLSLVMTAMATPEVQLIDPSRTGSITITKLVDDDAIGTLEEEERAVYIQENPDQLKPLDGIEYRVCKVAEIKQYSKDNVTSIGYAIDSSMADFFALSTDDIYDINALNEILKSKTVTETQDFLDCAVNTIPLPLTDTAGKTTLSNLPLGLYLISETPNETTLNGNPAFFVALPSSGPDGWEYDLTIFPKGLLPPTPSAIPVIPQTGDNFHIGDTIVSLVASVAGLAVTAYYLHCSKHKRKPNDDTLKRS